MAKRRLKAAKFFAEGKNASEVARLCGVRRQSAHAWLQSWEATGEAGLQSKGPAGPKSKLSEAQLKRWVKHWWLARRFMAMRPR